VRTGAGLQANRVIATDRIAELVTVGLRQPVSVSRPVRRLPWLGTVVGLLAAAASVVLILAAPRPQRPEPRAAGDTAALALLPELQALDERQLESILQSLGPTAADATPGVLPHLEDLTDSELEQLLRAEEGT
jgi:hypothetical protein